MVFAKRLFFWMLILFAPSAPTIQAADRRKLFSIIISDQKLSTLNQILQSMNVFISSLEKLGTTAKIRVRLHPEEKLRLEKEFPGIKIEPEKAPSAAKRKFINLIVLASPSDRTSMTAVEEKLRSWNLFIQSLRHEPKSELVYLDIKLTNEELSELLKIPGVNRAALPCKIETKKLQIKKRRGGRR